MTTAVEVDPKAYTVRVRLTSDVTRMFDVMSFQGGNMPVGASATAKLSSGLPLCLIGLDGRAPSTIALEKDALLTAPGCLVYSNSTSPVGISSKDNAVLKAGYICSAGGKVAAANSNFTPQPMTDCPNMPDPLATRQVPSDGPCKYLAKIILGGSETLQPGTYCGGLIITLGADVKMAPGIYVIKDGPFLVGGNSTLNGENVGDLSEGARVQSQVRRRDHRSLTAAKKSLPMTGLLIYDDPTEQPRCSTRRLPAGTTSS